MKRIMIVEDERIVAQDIQNRLEKLGYTVSTVASSGEEAIKKAGKITPDLILMDIVLKGKMDGIEAADIIRDQVNIPVVYLTAYADEETLQRAKFTEPYGYILKPFEDRELHIIIEMALYNHEIEKKLRKKEEMLHQEHDLLSRIMQTSPVGITVVNREGQITFANTYMEHILGITRDKITQRSYNAPSWHITDYTGDPFPDEQLPFRKVIETGEPVYDVRHAIEWPTGERVLLSINAAPLLSESGRVDGMVAIAENVTERVLAQKAVQYRLDFEELITTISTEFINLRLDQIDQGINTALEKIGKFTESDSSYIFLLHGGGTKLDNTHEWCAEGVTSQKDRLQNLDVETFKWGIDRFKKQGVLHILRLSDLPKKAHKEKELFQKAGIRSLISVPIVIGGTIYGLIGLNSIREERAWSDDVVSMLKIVAEIFASALERKRSEEALRESEEQYRTSIESMGDAVHVVDKALRIVLFNKAFREWSRNLGINPDVIGKPVLDVFPFLPDTVIDEYYQVFASGKPLITEETTKVGDREFITETRKIPITEEGAVHQVVTVIRDITKRKRAEMQLKTIFEASKAINSTMDMNETFKFISDAYQDLVGFDNFIIFLVSEHAEYIYAAYASEKIREKIKDLRLKYGEGLVGSSITSKKVILLGNAHKDKRARKIPGVTDTFTSQIVVPLITEGECVGAIHISKTIEDAYDEHDIDILKPLGEVISSAVRNSRLYHEIKEFSLELERRVEERSRRTEILLETRQNLQTERTWEKGLLTIIESIEKLGFERCGIFLVNSITKTLDSHFTKGTELPEKKISVPLRDTNYFGVKCVAEKRTIHVIEYDQKDGNQVVSEAQSFVWVPIIVRNEAFAALGADNIKSGRTITEEDVKDLEILASMCAAFIDRTRILIEPVAEKTLKTELKYWLDPLEGYIILEKKPKKCFDIFIDLVTHGIPGFVVSRSYPEKLRRQYTLERTPLLWLSRTEIENAISPDDLSKLRYIIEDFTKKSKESVILLDGLEYLITQATFDSILKYLQELKDTIVLNNSRLIVPLHRETLSPIEYSALEREFTVMEFD